MAKRARSRRRRPIEHRGLWAGRQKHDSSARERIFGDRWRKENDENHGDGILQKLMRSPRTPDMPWSGYAFIIGRVEAKIVASVVEWLGTNVGWCFLEGAIRECGFDLVRRERWNEKAAVRECTSIGKTWSGSCPHCGGLLPSRIERFVVNVHATQSIRYTNSPPDPILYECPQCAGPFTVRYGNRPARCRLCGVTSARVLKGRCENRASCDGRARPALGIQSALTKAP